MTTLGLLAIPALIVAVPAPRASAATTALPPAKSWVLVDADTGNVLAGLNEHQALPPGSISKILTAMVAVDWLPANAEIPVTAQAASAYPDDVGMKVGQQWSLGITLDALLTDSANDAAYALASDIGGSMQGFESVMATASSQLGLADSPVWHDPAGLDGTEGFDGGNELSARDAATLGRDVLSQPQLAQIVAARSEAITGPDGTVYDLTSQNLQFLQGYSGAIGVKTGFTDLAGNTIVAAATRSGRTMLAVV
ncbi:MAG: D-alanyl-D-alanine carboxypeptidase family protein, partial [Acidimicrobiales bacterium]